MRVAIPFVRCAISIAYLLSIYCLSPACLLCLAAQVRVFKAGVFRSGNSLLASLAAAAAMPSPEGEAIKAKIVRIFQKMPNWKFYSIVQQERGVEALTAVVLFGREFWISAKVAKTEYELLGQLLTNTRDAFRDALEFEQAQMTNAGLPMSQGTVLLVRKGLEWVEMAPMQAHALTRDNGLQWADHVATFRFDGGDLVLENKYMVDGHLVAAMDLRHTLDGEEVAPRNWELQVFSNNPEHLEMFVKTAVKLGALGPGIAPDGPEAQSFLRMAMAQPNNTAVVFQPDRGFSFRV